MTGHRRLRSPPSVRAVRTAMSACTERAAAAAGWDPDSYRSGAVLVTCILPPPGTAGPGWPAPSAAAAPSAGRQRRPAVHHRPARAVSSRPARTGRARTGPRPRRAAPRTRPGHGGRETPGAGKAARIRLRAARSSRSAISLSASMAAVPRTIAEPSAPSAPAGHLLSSSRSPGEERPGFLAVAGIHHPQITAERRQRRQSLHRPVSSTADIPARNEINPRAARGGGSG